MSTAKNGEVQVLPTVAEVEERLRALEEEVKLVRRLRRVVRAATAADAARARRLEANRGKTAG